MRARGAQQALRGLSLGLALFAILGLTGCAKRTVLRIAETQPVVRGVTIEQNKAIKDGPIVNSLAQRATPWQHWIPPLNFFYPRYYLSTAWRDDSTRIANYYALNGYFDARVLGSELQLSKRLRKNGTHRTVRIVHTVAEGEPSAVNGLRLLFEDETGRPARVTCFGDEAPVKPVEPIPGVGPGQGSKRAQRPSDSTTDELKLRFCDAMPVVEGRRFAMANAEAARKAVQGRLQNEAYARAEAELVVDAYPETKTVGVEVRASTGPRAVFGTSTVTGLDKVRGSYVLKKIAYKEGEPWSGRLLNRTQGQIYELGLFSLVTVTPVLPDEPVLNENGEEIVDVDIVLKERKPRTLRWGVGVGWDRQGFDVRANATVGHDNLFRRRVRSSAYLNLGYKFLGVDDHFPVGSLKLDLRWPDFPAQRLTVFGTATTDLDLETGYKYVTPALNAGITWAALKPLRMTLSGKVSYFDTFLDARFKEAQAGGELADTDISFEDGYLLTSLRQEIVLDLRDDPLRAGKGFYARVAVDEVLGQTDPDGAGTGALLAVSYRYVRFAGDVRGYIPLGTPRLVLATRAGVQYIHTWGDFSDVPIAEAVYTGGDGSVRGWKSRYLAPRTIDISCVEETTRRDCILPVGGKFGVNGAVELRGNVWGPLWLAGFMDLGRVWADASEAVGKKAFFEDLQVSVGGGVRLDTAIGRFRLDFAVHPRPWTDNVFREPNYRVWRVSRDENGDALRDADNRIIRSLDWTEPPNWNFHFGIGESF